MWGFQAEKAGVDDPRPDFILDTGKEHALEMPVGDIDQLPVSLRLVGQHITEKVLGDEIGFDPAERAFDQMVRFFQRDRGTALGALMFDL